MPSSSAGKPSRGTPIALGKDGRLQVADDPILPYIEGDGIGPDIWRATKLVLDRGIECAYGGKRRLEWFEILAGEKANARTGAWLPDETLEAMRTYRVALKGPLTTPVGGGIRSLNVAIRQKLDLYACVRPVRYLAGAPSPMKRPQDMNVVIFRENTEDLYAGIEWEAGSAEANKLIEFVGGQLGKKIRAGSGVGLKPMSKEATQNLMRRALRYAVAHKRRVVTLVHKGNIMKFTEGAFRNWAYELAAKEFGADTISEQEVSEKHGGRTPAGKILVNDRIADAMFQMLLLRPSDFEVLVTPNLNGDYLSDACAAQVGGLGLAPGANMSDEVACFEATHGTAPKYAGQDKVNPGSLILSGVLMLEHLGWNEAAALIVQGLEKTISQKRVTYDLERMLEGATLVKCSEFAAAVVENMKARGARA